MVFAESGEVLYIYNISKCCYEIVDRIATDPNETGLSADGLFEKLLQNMLGIFT